MPSTVVRHISYDETAHELHVAFTSGEVYTYYDVAKHVYAAFRTASSKGQFFTPTSRTATTSAATRSRLERYFLAAAFGGSSSPASSASAVSKSFASRKFL